MHKLKAEAYRDLYLDNDIEWIIVDRRFGVLKVKKKL